MFLSLGCLITFEPVRHLDDCLIVLRFEVVTDFAVKIVREEIQEAEARRWADDNAELVAAYSAMVERDGLPLAKYRTF